MKLQEMQGALDAGEMVKKRHGDGLVAAGKIDGIYVSLQGAAYTPHESFEALCAYVEPDAEAFPSEECGWEISLPPTPRQLASIFIPELRDQLTWLRDALNEHHYLTE